MSVIRLTEEIAAKDARIAELKAMLESVTNGYEYMMHRAGISVDAPAWETVRRAKAIASLDKAR